MDQLKHVNWNEIVRQAILEAVEREEILLKEKNYEAIKKASKDIDKLRKNRPRIGTALLR